MYELQADLIMCCQPHAAQSHKAGGEGGVGGWCVSDNCDLLLFSMSLQGAISVLYD